MSRARDLYNDGYDCSCHISPPCSFCVSLSKEEVDIYANDGIDGLKSLWMRQDFEEGEK